MQLSQAASHALAQLRQALGAEDEECDQYNDANLERTEVSKHRSKIPAAHAPSTVSSWYISARAPTGSRAPIPDRETRSRGIGIGADAALDQVVVRAARDARRLVNNAGMSPRLERLSDISESPFDRVIAIVSVGGNGPQRPREELLKARLDGGRKTTIDANG